MGTNENETLRTTNLPEENGAQMTKHQAQKLNEERIYPQNNKRKKK